MNLTGAEVDYVAEQSVLGAILLDSNVLDEITFLEPRDFTGRNQQIFSVMRYLNENNKPIDIVTVTEEYNKFGKADMEGVNYLVKLADSVPTTANAKHYAEIVRSKAIGRRGAETGNKIANLSRSEFETDEEYFSAVESLVAEMRPKDHGMMRSLSETRDSYFKHLKTPAEFIKTGFSQFDTWSGGLGRGDLFISAGRPSVGKTAKLLQRVYGVAQQKSGVVLIYSQEMDENQIKDRMVSAISGVNFNRIRRKNLSDKELAQIEDAYERLEGLPIFVQDSSGVTIEEIRATARRFKRQYGRIAMIAVDYLQIMNIPQRREERRDQAIGRVTKTAKQIAREMNCCFIMLSQMNRDSEKQQKPMLSNLKESSSIEQDADMIEFLWHDSNDYDDRGKVIQQFIAKGRNVGTNNFRLLFKGWVQSFQELDDKVM